MTSSSCPFSTAASCQSWWWAWWRRRSPRARHARHAARAARFYLRAHHEPLHQPEPPLHCTSRAHRAEVKAVAPMAKIEAVDDGAWQATQTWNEMRGMHPPRPEHHSRASRRSSSCRCRRPSPRSSRRSTVYRKTSPPSGCRWAASARHVLAGANCSSDFAPLVLIAAIAAGCALATLRPEKRNGRASQRVAQGGWTSPRSPRACSSPFSPSRWSRASPSRPSRARRSTMAQVPHADYSVERRRRAVRPGQAAGDGRDRLYPVAVPLTYALLLRARRAPRCRPLSGRPSSRAAARRSLSSCTAWVRSRAATGGRSPKS